MTRRPLLLALDLLVGLSAVGGGVMLALDPSGRSVQLAPELLAHSPFRTYFVPGLVLAGVVGGSALCAAVAHLTRAAHAARWTAFAGAILGGWIVAEIVQVRTFHPLQPILLGVALVQIALGLRAPLRRDVADKAAAFLASRRVLFVGLSAKPGEFSRAVADALVKHGVAVVGVNPRGAGDGGFARVADVPEVPRAALLMVPAAQADAAVKECVDAGVQAVWFHRGVGPGSASPEAVARAEKAGMTVITDACPLMFLESGHWLHGAHRWGRGLAAPHAHGEPAR